MEDAQIIDLIYDRSEQGLSELDGKYRKLLMSVTSGLLRCNEDAEECVSDAYVKVWNVIPPYRPKHLGAFICKIARNAAIDKYRYESRGKRSGGGEVLFSELEDENGACNIGTYDEDISSLSDEISAFLKNADVESRTIFTRRYFLAESISSLAERFGKTENYISLKLFRMREKLKKYLEKRGYNVESR